MAAVVLTTALAAGVLAPSGQSALPAPAPFDAKFLGEKFDDLAGFSVSPAGDFNGDGVDDIAVAAPWHAVFPNLAFGATYLYFGPVQGTSSLSTSDLKILGENEMDQSGWNVDAAGDTNGDGFDDLLIGSPGSEASGDLAGAAYLVRGRSLPVDGLVPQLTTLAAADFKFYGDAFDQAGLYVAGVGDVNADGFDDILVGAPGNTTFGVNTGVAYLFYGPVSGTLAPGDEDAVFIGEGANNFAGRTISEAGDINGDGFDDFLIGAPGDREGGLLAGAVYLIKGSPALTGTFFLSGSFDVKFFGASEHDSAGFDVAGAGDVNGDGLSDILIGANQEPQLGNNPGFAYLMYGSPTLSGKINLSAADVTFVGNAAGDMTGESVTLLGDVDADGFDEVVIGAPFEDTFGPDAGVAWFVRGSNALSGTLNLAAVATQLHGEGDGDQFGRSVERAGDVDGNGVADVIIGAPAHAPVPLLGARFGAAYLQFN